MFDYEWIIDYDNVTLQDCLIFDRNNKHMVISDGHIINIVLENNDGE